MHGLTTTSNTTGSKRDTFDLSGAPDPKSRAAYHLEQGPGLAGVPQSLDLDLAARLGVGSGVILGGGGHIQHIVFILSYEEFFRTLRIKNLTNTMERILLSTA